MEHITPSIEELTPNHKIRCSQPDCKSVFTNLGNYQMHVQRHHKVHTRQKNCALRLFYCPDIKCVYNANHAKGKSFKELKYIRQHYQKVHLKKKYRCTRCQSDFLTEQQLRIHIEKLCGKKFICLVCQWTCATKAALLVHLRRKGHVFDKAMHESFVPVIPKVPIPRIKSKHNSNGRQAAGKYESSESSPLLILNSGVFHPVVYPFNVPYSENRQDKISCFPNVDQPEYFQSELEEINQSHSECNVKNSAAKDVSNKHACVQTDWTTDVHLWRRNAETQTESFIHSEIVSNARITDQGLSPSAIKQAQMCGHMFPELGLVDIQTQTSWPYNSILPNGNKESEHGFTSNNAIQHCILHDIDVYKGQELNMSEVQERKSRLMKSYNCARSHVFVKEGLGAVEKFIESICNVDESNLMGARASTLESINYDVTKQTESSQTEESILPFASEIEDIREILRDTETQTEFGLPGTSAVYCDQVLEPTVHMYTQTCNDILTGLELTDIETQTPWSTESPLEKNCQYKSSVTCCFQDELLVSTETQTSFTQCLLESCTGMNESNTNEFTNFYNTQYTQTCNSLLGGLFGQQEQDVMNGFQSTYTQT